MSLLWELAQQKRACHIICGVKCVLLFTVILYCKFWSAAWWRVAIIIPLILLLGAKEGENCQNVTLKPKPMASDHHLTELLVLHTGRIYKLPSLKLEDHKGWPSFTMMLSNSLK